MLSSKDLCPCWESYLSHPGTVLAQLSRLFRSVSCSVFEARTIPRTYRSLINTDSFWSSGQFGCFWTFTEQCYQNAGLDGHNTFRDSALQPCKELVPSTIHNDNFWGLEAESRDVGLFEHASSFDLGHSHTNQPPQTLHKGPKSKLGSTHELVYTVSVGVCQDTSWHDIMRPSSGVACSQSSKQTCCQLRQETGRRWYQHGVKHRNRGENRERICMVLWLRCIDMNCVSFCRLWL